MGMQLSNKKELLNILLIEDEKALLDLNAIILENDFTVHKSSNLDDAKRILEHNSIHIIISDHFIGDENGLQFLISLKDNYPDIVKILFTSCVSQEVMIQSHNSREIFKYLIKPCSNDEFLENAKLAEIAWNVLQQEKKQQAEFEKLKSTFDEVSESNYKFENKVNNIKNLSKVSSKNLFWLILGFFTLGTLTLLTLYVLKSFLGIDIFR